MKAGDVITQVDTENPNIFDPKTKLIWLNDLDNRIFNSVILTHEHEKDIARKAIESVGDELLIPEPYGMDCYTAYIKAKISAAYMETERHNQHMTMFNSFYQDFLNYYNREHMPLSRGGNRFKF